MTRICALLVALAALALPATALAKDGDHDRMPDKWEKKFGLNRHKNDARKDRDHDGLRNLAEFQAGTNPNDADTDNDGTGDDQEQAGKVVSFDSSTGTLTISLFGGGTLTGVVNGDTEIECEGADQGNAQAPAGDTRGDGTPEDRVMARDGADDGPGHDQGDDHGDGANCGTEALTANRVVKEADISGNGTQTIFEKVELAG
jgi:hypothetical protein